MIIDAEITLTSIHESHIDISEVATSIQRARLNIPSHILYPGNLFSGGSGAFHWTLKMYPHYVISKQSIETGEVTEYDISHFLNNAIYERNIINGGNRPPGFLFNISPDDRYVLICLYGSESIVYDTQENKSVRYSNRDNFQKEWNEVKLGFDKDGNIYCGTQDISPMFLLRKFPSGDVIREYRFAINYAGDKFIPYQVGEANQFKLGINYNYLQTPFESPNRKYTVFSFTVFQFQYMYAVVMVCDNKSGELVYKQLVSTSRWSYFSQPFAFSPDERYFFHQDNQNEICCIDLNNGLMTSRFRLQKMDPRTASTIATFFLTPDDNIVVQLALPIYYYSPTREFRPPSVDHPLVLTSLWNPIDNTVTYPEPWVKEGAYTLRHWISPDKKIVATYYVDYDPDDDYRIARRREEAPDTLAFWNIDTGKLLHKIEGNITNVNFSSDWKHVDVTSWEEGEKIIQSNTRYTINMRESR